MSFGFNLIPFIQSSFEPMGQDLAFTFGRDDASLLRNEPADLLQGFPTLIADLDSTSFPSG